MQIRTLIYDQKLMMKDLSKYCIACKSQLQYFLSAKDYNLWKNKSYTLYKCPHCWTEAILPLPKKEEQKEFYPKDYYSYNIKKGMGKSMLHKIVDFWMKIVKYSFVLLNKQPTDLKILTSWYPWGNFLDVGCGSGYLGKTIKDYWMNYFGFEIGTPETKNSIWYNTDIRKENFDDNKFDIIYISHVFEHIDCPNETLIFLKKILKPNGKMIITIPTVDALNGFLFKGYAVERDIPRHLFNYTKKGVDLLLSWLGFHYKSKYLSNYWFFSSLKWLFKNKYWIRLNWFFSVLNYFPLMDIILSIPSKTNQIEYTITI